MLLGAFAFQYIGGLAPCPMCIWQRWPHAIAVLIAVLAVLSVVRVFNLAGALALLVGAGIGFYHAGVERGLFEGPDTCTSGPIENQSTDALLDSIMNAPLVRCDEIAWSFAGISMAGWNGIVSLALTAIWLAAWRNAGTQFSSSASQ